MFDGRLRARIEAGLKRLATGERESDLQDLNLRVPDGRTLQVCLEFCRSGDGTPPDSLPVMLEDITASLWIRRQSRTSEAGMQSVVRAMTESRIVVDGMRGVRIANVCAARRPSGSHWAGMARRCVSWQGSGHSLRNAP